MYDIYELAVNYLEANPDQILEVWNDPKSNPAGILFQAASPSGDADRNEENNAFCGDICEIVSLEAVAYTDEITVLILDELENEKAIPVLGSDGYPIMKTDRDTLLVFAQWQHMFDITWNRSPVRKLHEWGYEGNALQGDIDDVVW